MNHWELEALRPTKRKILERSLRCCGLRTSRCSRHCSFLWHKNTLTMAEQCKIKHEVTLPQSCHLSTTQMMNNDIHPVEITTKCRFCSYFMFHWFIRLHDCECCHHCTHLAVHSGSQVLKVILMAPPIAMKTSRWKRCTTSWTDHECVICEVTFWCCFSHFMNGVRWHNLSGTQCYNLSTLQWRLLFGLSKSMHCLWQFVMSFLEINDNGRCDPCWHGTFFLDVTVCIVW